MLHGRTGERDRLYGSARLDTESVAHTPPGVGLYIYVYIYGKRRRASVADDTVEETTGWVPASLYTPVE